MADGTQPTVGMTVYAVGGTELGSVRGFGDDDFLATIREGLMGTSVEHERADHEFSEAELMWRCSDYGETGDLDELPDACPNCGVEREQLYYWTEDRRIAPI